MEKQKVFGLTKDQFNQFEDMLSGRAWLQARTFLEGLNCDPLGVDFEKLNKAQIRDNKTSQMRNKRAFSEGYVPLNSLDPDGSRATEMDHIIPGVWQSYLTMSDIKRICEYRGIEYMPIHQFIKSPINCMYRSKYQNEQKRRREQKYDKRYGDIVTFYIQEYEAEFNAQTIAINQYFLRPLFAAERAINVIERTQEPEKYEDGIFRRKHLKQAYAKLDRIKQRKIRCLKAGEII